MRTAERYTLLVAAAVGMGALAMATATTTLAAPAPPKPGGPAKAVATAQQAAGAQDAGVEETPRRRKALVPPNERVNACADCHAKLTEGKLRQPALDLKQSAHRDDRIGCVGCHKGDPRDPTADAHKATGFTAHPQQPDTAGLCGSCHTDPGFMRHINSRLPVGQEALYRLSLHGRLTAAGDTNAPTCSTCHGRHDVLAVASPKSPVNRANVATLCSGCHADKKRMAKYKIPTDQHAKWEKSVHGEAFRKGHPNAPSCTGCHGPHSATPPEAASVARACGRCHEEELGLFEQSPHSKGFRKKGLHQCVACHNNHDVIPPNQLVIGDGPQSVCGKCHEKDDKPLVVARNIARLLREAHAAAEQARAHAARAKAKGLHVGGIAAALDQMSTAELKLPPAIHTIDSERVEAAAGAVKVAGDKADKLIAEAEQARNVERRLYFGALAISIVFFLALVLKTRELERRRRQTTP